MLQRRLLAVPWTPENPAAAHPSPVVKSLKNAFARSCFFISRLSPCYILATINVNVKSRTFPWFDVPATQNPSCRTLSIKYLDRSSASYSRGLAPDFFRVRWSCYQRDYVSSRFRQCARKLRRIAEPRQRYHEYLRVALHQ